MNLRAACVTRRVLEQNGLHREKSSKQNITKRNPGKWETAQHWRMTSAQQTVAVLSRYQIVWVVYFFKVCFELFYSYWVLIVISLGYLTGHILP